MDWRGLASEHANFSRHLLPTIHRPHNVKTVTYSDFVDHLGNPFNQNSNKLHLEIILKYVLNI